MAVHVTGRSTHQQNVGQSSRRADIEREVLPLFRVRASTGSLAEEIIPVAEGAFPDRGKPSHSVR